MTTPISEERHAQSAARSNPAAQRLYPNVVDAAYKSTVADCQKNDWKSHKDLCASRVLLSGVEPVHPKFHHMVELFISFQTLTDPVHILGPRGSQLSQFGMRESEAFVDLQVFKGLREEIQQSGDKRVELMAFKVVRRGSVVRVCLSLSIQTLSI